MFSPKEHEEMRRQLWINICEQLARSERCTSKYSMVEWADHALDAFDKRFAENSTTIRDKKCNLGISLTKGD